MIRMCKDGKPLFERCSFVDERRKTGCGKKPPRDGRGFRYFTKRGYPRCDDHKEG